MTQSYQGPLVNTRNADESTKVAQFLGNDILGGDLK
jgi:hypothetical protein